MGSATRKGNGGTLKVIILSVKRQPKFWAAFLLQRGSKCAVLVVNAMVGSRFVVIIDEWDVLVRDASTNKAIQPLEYFIPAAAAF
jgi:hypothetical protein